MQLNNRMDQDDSDEGEIQFNGDRESNDELGNVEENVFPPEEEEDNVINLEEDDQGVDLTGAEFSQLNSTLDQLQAALDRLESRNAGIHEELLELLQSNREIRMKIIEENSSVSQDDPGCEVALIKGQSQQMHGTDKKSQAQIPNPTVEKLESQLHDLEVSTPPATPSTSKTQ